ncbi:GTP 3',8-cyclase MoaA [Sphingobacterium thalpophilum]|uniref:GTP 3',8-cyclase n=1 Tax=Sphingobacterium thalpophilum TaxID=259 RepID=A0A4U9VR92_9SPHI|nr:GTP 3',8-cyclase MoaA [Sphingobacterium thalpophilum]VTR49916.1 Probable molybdopterin cofactor synthesis protein A [Sphingobacterium thalpophilum]
MLTDKYGRSHTYLRISLTDNCNLRCFYCMPEEDYAFTPHAQLMQVDEIEQLAKVFVAHGVRKIRLTGGEPLVRRDAPAIIAMLSQLPVELHMTTNGIRIDDMLGEIVSAGFKSVNISLDTLRPERFIKITRRNYFERVRANIDLLLKYNVITKINVVVMKGINDDEILDFVALTKSKPVEIRFIEFMPFSGNKWSSNQVLTYDDIVNTVQQAYTIQPVTARPHDTAKAFSIPGHLGRIAIISTMTAPFCAGCNRIRLTADGKLKNCLFSAGETDLLSTLRTGGDVLPLIQQNILSKAQALGGQLAENFEQIETDFLQNRSMITIGG